ncbi:hypothetical protein B0J12DRAFT_453296 [Macrophomina phaseolina]|uniref:Uncharacterized protein n=1 Tax=Macrophomina phaseolina TaxID=35725 RepID=A0ABQ8GFL5_9PEZI|nr:hypothetical protein B0J12DRAFT_453296 [Macrophomina phaseolina]
MRAGGSVVPAHFLVTLRFQLLLPRRLCFALVCELLRRRMRGENWNAVTARCLLTGSRLISRRSAKGGVAQSANLARLRKHFPLESSEGHIQPRYRGLPRQSSAAPLSRRAGTSSHGTRQNLGGLVKLLPDLSHTAMRDRVVGGDKARAGTPATTAWPTSARPFFVTDGAAAHHLSRGNVAAGRALAGHAGGLLSAPKRSFSWVSRSRG